MLVDNGSTRVTAAVQLRALAQELGQKNNTEVHAVSLKHSDRIAVDDVEDKLSGKPARVFKEFMSEYLHAGQREFILIPLFFGNSRALTSFVPDQKAELESEFGAFNLQMSEVLYPLPEGESELVDILYEHAISTAKGNSKEALRNIVLVDHGSPLPAVNAVRQHIASALNTKLNASLGFDITIAQAAMERRAEKEYDFNGELLKDYLSNLAASGETHVSILLLFLLAGTHAGEGGDISQICADVMQKHPHFKVSISPLISQNERLVSCLAKRLNTLQNDNNEI